MTGQAGTEAEKREYVFIAGKSAKWYSHYGNQCRRVPQESENCQGA